MNKQDAYRAKLRTLDEWDALLLAESGLPGPRANIDLAQAVADEGNTDLFHRYAAYSAASAPVNSPYEFLAFCGVVGLGRLLAEGDRSLLPVLRGFASDPRWRIREAVAMALQRLGDTDMDALITEMNIWSTGAPFEQRAAAAAVCEPRLLRKPQHALAALNILNTITETIDGIEDRHSDDFLALRKGLAYCWSVAAAALPEAGKKAMETWLVDEDKDIRWIMRENLKKNRLVRIDPGWVEDWQTRAA